jgi:hypothetical protein
MSITQYKTKESETVGHAARIGEKRNSYVLVGKPERRYMRRWEDNIKIDLRERDCEDVNWMHVSQDRVYWRALVNTVVNIRVP